MFTKLVIPSNHLILYCTLLLLFSIFPRIGVFSSESVLCIKWLKYWSFSFNISPSNEHWGLISSRIDCFGLFAVQGTSKSLLQCHSSKASILRYSAFFIVQLSHPHMTKGPKLAAHPLLWHSHKKSISFDCYEKVQMQLFILLIHSFFHQLIDSFSIHSPTKPPVITYYIPGLALVLWI